MSKMKLFLKNIPSLLLSGVIILSSGGFLVNALDEESVRDDTKEFLYQRTIENAQKFSKQYEDYEEYIDLIRQEIIDTGMNKNVIDVFSTYIYLEENGLISLGDDFTYGKSDYEIMGNFGLSVISGVGVCRNQADNLCKIFNALGYEATLSYGEIYDTAFISGTNNHVVTCVYSDGMYYLLDPTNKTIFLCNILGQFKSIDYEDVKFYPSVYGDELYRVLASNTGLHFYLADDYKVKDIISTRRDESYEKAKSNSAYYANFESDYLQELEEQIDSDMREYRKIR